MIKNYYQILNVSLTASHEEIETSYRCLWEFWESETNASQVAFQKTEEIKEAFWILSDHNRRESYNQIFKVFYFSILDSNHLTSENEITSEIQNKKETNSQHGERLSRNLYIRGFNTLNKFRKEIKNRLKYLDNFLNKIIENADRTIENFAYYLPYVLVITVVFIIVLVSLL